MKSVVLAEKPSVARDIARVLGCEQKGNGYLEGKQYIVTWALGHLVTHAQPEQYDNDFKEWKMDTLPIIPEPFKLVPIKQSMKQFNAVKSQLQRGDVNEVIIATDAGREGELVARWILEKTNTRKPVKRLWISSVTDKAIKDGFNNLKDGRDYENLYAAAVARAEADWVVGINATRALTVKYNAQLSTGRVQTPTLAMIAEREQQIRNFQPKPYYGMQAVTDQAAFTWTDGNSTQSFDKDKVDKLFNKLENTHEGTVTDIKITPKRQPAPPLFDLTELQKEAYKRYSWSAKETLNTLQGLYERYKIVTYPRTDSKHLTSDMRDTLKDRVKAVQVGPYRSLAAMILKNPVAPQKGVIDDAKVSDHHAIIPTEETPPLHELSEKEHKLYDMIVKRFLSVFYPNYEYDQTTIKLTADGETFQTKGNTIQNEGWKRVYKDEGEDNDTTLPPFENGQKLTIKGIALTDGKTKPPAFFNEGTLLGAMENPAQFMSGESKELIQAIGETGGLGTVATRADVIDKLFNTFLIEKKGKDLTITSKGRQLLELVPEDLKSPKLTADWEQQLTKIAKGQLKKETFIKEMIAFAGKSVSDIKKSDRKFKHDNITGKMCPDCGKPLLEVNGKRGKMNVCQDRECGYKKQVAMQTNARCPNCHKKLEMQGEGDGKIFVCKCGHREKLSAFEKRKKSGQSKANKKDVNKYLNQQDEAPQNTAMADALKKLLGQTE
ncbi:DNA topoisomerase III [Planococcus antarcticus DSM 14505]|uniref:DNA topoisomerase 3 n=1 Tax=Planococcus antarcticus DSM 14505 TaxID=1185653 RepID=A0A1C7DEY7_9BACL|nr:DNA topoisomerase III [Planococcus antarcticus]ANU09977.1 DNA topoisomerase III [Planococcus antarcticus DSM 14505]EIM07488.1 DNA topoisomerase III [Planococcus antarcticus DSM 14505]